MKVFISWSGEPSRELALALADWFPKVLQGIEPFVSSKDIDKGATWVSDLAQELSDSAYGVICMTPENLQSPWLHYEAGAISSAINSRVCPVLLGVAKEEVKPPLNQLQLTSVEQGELLQLMVSMNKAAGGLVDHRQLEETVEVWWPKLEKKISSISIPEATSALDTSPEPPKPEAEETEMLRELLSRVRRLEKSTSATRSAEHAGRRRPAGAGERYLRRRFDAEGVSILNFRADEEGFAVIVGESLQEIPSSELLVDAMQVVARNEKTAVRMVTPAEVLVAHPDGDIAIEDAVT